MAQPFSSPSQALAGAAQRGDRLDWLRLDARGLVCDASPDALQAFRELGMNAEAGTALPRCADVDVDTAWLRTLSNSPRPIVFRGRHGLLVTMASRERRGYLLRFAPPNSGPRLLTLLLDEFDLTPTQADVALSIANGLSLADLARNRGCSINTVRAHANALYEKLGVCRQSQLVTLLQQLHHLLLRL